MADLPAAYDAAAPGDTITVAKGDPFWWSLVNKTKADPGVAIVLPADQLICITAQGGSPNIMVHRGIVAFDAVEAFYVANRGRHIGYGSSTTNPSPKQFGCYGLNTSKIGLFGCIVDQSHYGTVFDFSTDITVRCANLNYQRADSIQLSSCQRVLLEGNKTTEGIRSHYTSVYGLDDPRPPEYDVAANAPTTLRAEIVHADALQWFGDTFDLDVLGNDFTVFGQTYYSGGSSKPKTVRGRIAGNKGRQTSGRALQVSGSHLTIANNDIGRHPSAPSDKPQIRINAEPGDDTTGPVQGYGNTAGPDGVIVAPGKAGVFDGTSMGGDAGVILPTPPGQSPLPGTPAVVLPGYTFPAIPPEIFTPPELLVRSRVDPTKFATEAGDGRITEVQPGDWIAMSRGSYKAFAQAITEFRHYWMRGGVQVATGPGYQLTAADAGQPVWCELEIVNASGVSERRRSTGYILLAA